jgi:hypothetical protein
MTIVVSIRNMIWIPESRTLYPSFPSAFPIAMNDDDLSQTRDSRFDIPTNFASVDDHYPDSSSSSSSTTSVSNNNQNLGSQSRIGDITDATIIVTSNYIPTHPSTYIIDRTIESISRYIALFPAPEDRVLEPGGMMGSDANYSSTTSNRTRIPMIITVDGLSGRRKGSTNYERGILLDEYVEALRTRYSDDSQYDVLILPQGNNIKLIRNMEFALNYVTTKFIYVIQHDLPFILPVNHNAMVEYFEDRPDIVRLIRFGRHPTLSRSKDWPNFMGVNCGDELFLSSQNHHHYHHQYGGELNLSMTHTWSDK